MNYPGNFQSTNRIDTKDIPLAIEDMKMTAKNRRRVFERRWYDNNFFDDGFHFRYLSRSSNKIVDLSERATIYTPQRSIPKSSRQIRGVANLLMSQDPTPTVYPEPINQSSFSNPQAYLKAVENAKQVAKRRGKWLYDEWIKDDGTGDTVLDKVAQMVLLSLKHGISFMQVWPDATDEEIRTQVFDAFDIYIYGDITSIYQAPFIIKCIPFSLAEIKSNDLFEEDQREQLNPDNHKASSEIKEAYLQARYGRDTTSDQGATIILNEAFVKEYVDEENLKRIKNQEDSEKILKAIQGKGDDYMGKPIIRHIFTAANVWLYDKYTALSEYPFVDYRLEAGPLYGVPLIERFMPANKSLDSIVSRVERYTHTMVTGSWLKRRGENFHINNIAGGQIIEYDATPPTQNQIAPIPPFVYEFIGLLQNFIEEQGVSTTTLGKLPAGVRANAAIESLKESEYANLIIASRRLNSMLKRLARKYLEIADENYVEPHVINTKEENKTDTFAVIGERAIRERKKLKAKDLENYPYQVISLSKDAKVDIEIEQGMAYTKEGQKATMQQVMDSMIQAVQIQAIPPQALQSVWKRYLEVYQFGATAEFMEDLDKALQAGNQMNEQQLMQMKVAVLEALKDAGEIGPEADKTKVQAAQLGTLQALKDSGIAKATLGANQKPPAESISYKDAPEDIKRQMEQQAGLRPSRMVSPGASDQMLKHAKALSEIRKANEPEEPKGEENDTER